MSAAETTTVKVPCGAARPAAGHRTRQTREARRKAQNGREFDPLAAARARTARHRSRLRLPAGAAGHPVVPEVRPASAVGLPAGRVGRLQQLHRGARRQRVLDGRPAHRRLRRGLRHPDAGPRHAGRAAPAARVRLGEDPHQHRPDRELGHARRRRHHHLQVDVRLRLRRPQLAAQQGPRGRSDRPQLVRQRHPGPRRDHPAGGLGRRTVRRHHPHRGTHPGTRRTRRGGAPRRRRLPGVSSGTSPCRSSSPSSSCWRPCRSSGTWASSRRCS